MYAICFDLEPEALRSAYSGPSHTNAYLEIRWMQLEGE
jgi:virulence-associated protein VapD